MPRGLASRPPPSTAMRRRPTATARPWPCLTRPTAPGPTPSAARTCCAARPAPGPRPARSARPPTPSCGRRRSPAPPGRPAAWPRPPSGWAARPASGRSSSTRPCPSGCSARPSRRPGPATARSGRCCWPGWPAGGPPARASGSPSPASRSPSPSRWPWPAASATSGPWSRSWPTRRRPGTARCGRTARWPPWPPRPSWTAWPASWMTTTCAGRPAGSGRPPCSPPATWTPSTG